MNSGRKIGVLVFFFLLLSGIWCGSAYARDKAYIQQETIITKAWEAYYAGNFKEALKLLRPAESSKYESIKAETAYLQGRCLWNIEDKKAKEAATKLWQGLPKISQMNPTTARMEISGALILESNGDLKGATSKLEAVLRRQFAETSTPEAAIEYARICGLQKQWNDAYKALDFAEKFTKLQAKYGEISQAAVEPFLNEIPKMRNKLAVMKNHVPGKAEFDAAWKLLEEQKYKDAAIAFKKIIYTYPDSDFRYRAELAVGDCMAGALGTRQAVKYWEEFIEKDPGGQWRGQAYLRLIDIYLNENLDMASAKKYANLAGANLKKGVKETSWTEAAYDIALRCGMIEYLQGNNSAAASWFAESTRYTKDKTKLDAANEFIEITKSDKNANSRKKLLPVEFEQKDQLKYPKMIVLLKMAEMYRRVGMNDISDNLLARLIGGSKGRIRRLTKSTTQAKSYATFCRAVILDKAGQKDKAQRFYKYSYQKFPVGSWQDESIWQLACDIKTKAEVLKEQKLDPEAAKKAKLAAMKKAADKKHGKEKAKEKVLAKITPNDKKPLTLADIKKREQVEDVAENTYANALGGAENYWQEIVKRYPKSLHAGPSLYELGTLEILNGKFKAAKFTLVKLAVDYPQCPQAPKGLYELGTAMLDAGLHNDGVFILDQLVQRYPKDLICGDAYLALIDLQIEEYYDFAKARAYAKMGVEWVEGLKLDPAKIKAELEQKLIAKKPEKGQAWSTEKPKDPTLLLCYTLYTRAGLVEYLAGNSKEAFRVFNAAIPYDQGTENHKKCSTGLNALVQIAKGSQKPLTPEELVQYFKRDKQKNLTMLADLYLMCGEFEKAEGLYLKLLDGDEPLGKITTGLEAYLLWRVGQALELQGRHEEALAYLKRLYLKKYEKFPYAADGTFRVATWGYNYTQDHKEGMKRWKYIFNKYPDHPESERALFYYLDSAIALKKYPQAVAACKLYLQRYPEGRWAKRIQRAIIPDIKKKVAEKNEKSKG